MLKSVVMAYHFIGPDGPTDKYTSCTLGPKPYWFLYFMEENIFKCTNMNLLLTEERRWENALKLKIKFACCV